MMLFENNSARRSKVWSKARSKAQLINSLVFIIPLSPSYTFFIQSEEREKKNRYKERFFTWGEYLDFRSKGLRYCSFRLYFMELVCFLGSKMWTKPSTSRWSLIEGHPFFALLASSMPLLCLSAEGGGK